MRAVSSLDIASHHCGWDKAWLTQVSSMVLGSGCLDTELSCLGFKILFIDWMVIWWRRWTGGFEIIWAFGFWEFSACPIVCSIGDEWGSNEFESCRQVLGLELGDEEFKCKEF